MPSRLLNGGNVVEWGININPAWEAAPFEEVELWVNTTKWGSKVAHEYPLAYNIVDRVELEPGYKGPSTYWAEPARFERLKFPRRFKMNRDTGVLEEVHMIAINGELPPEPPPLSQPRNRLEDLILPPALKIRNT